MNLIDRLTRENKELLSMMDEITHLIDGERSSHDYVGSFQRIMAHEGSKDEVLYDVVADLAGISYLIALGRDQQSEIRQAIEDLNAITADNIRWEPSMGWLNDLLKMHYQMEEGELFPMVLEVMDEEELSELDQQYVQAERAMSRPPSRVMNRI